MSEWKEYKLDDLAEITSSKRIFYSDYVSDGVRFLRSKEIIEKSLGETSGEPLYIARERFEEIKSKFGAPVDGDLLISAVGERSGIPYVVRNLGDFYFKDGNLIWFRNIKSELSIDFFCYWIKSSIGQLSLDSIMIGSAQKALTIAGLKSLVLKIPKIEFQTAIASILSSLDDKIDLLHRQNATLEKMAETLFRQWFVEEAKEEWEEVKLSKIVDVINGVSYKSEELNPSKTAMVTLKSFDRNGGFRMDGFKEYTGKYKEHHILKEGDLVVAHTDITQDAEVIGNPVMVVGNPTYETLVFSMDLVKVIRKDIDYSNEFLYLLMKMREFKEHCLGYSNGSTVLHLSKKAIPEYVIKIPPKNLIKEFSIIAAPIVQKQFKNQTHIRTLTTLRDNLLPKLMSGEVIVKI